MVQKKLILRLSSLGDVILACSALEAFPNRSPSNPDFHTRSDSPLHWVVAHEFRSLLENHPKIHRIFGFQRSSGLNGWWKLCRELWEEGYTEVYDLHCSLRTRLLQFLFLYWSVVEGRRFPRWKTISKQRLRLYSYFIFKRALPKSFRPDLMVQRFSRCVGGTGDERPNFSHMIKNESLPKALIEQSAAFGGRYVCVMPSSRWDGKKWPVTHFVDVLRSLKALPVILGTRRDPESLELCQVLAAHRIAHYSGVGEWDLPQTATVLAYSAGYLGVDTGLAHLSEAVGVPVLTLFGPTVSDMGFGPWRPESKVIESSLWCRPCGKDGRYCFRPREKYKCMKTLYPEKVRALLESERTLG